MHITLQTFKEWKKDTGPKAEQIQRELCHYNLVLQKDSFVAHVVQCKMNGSVKVTQSRQVQQCNPYVAVKPDIYLKRRQIKELLISK